MKTVDLMLCLIIIACLICVAGINETNAFKKGYRQGQIDYASGIVKYELVVHPDSTRTWELKGEKK